MSEDQQTLRERADRLDQFTDELFPVRVGNFRVKDINLSCRSCGEPLRFSNAPARMIEHGDNRFVCEALGLCRCGVRCTHLTYTSTGSRLVLRVHDEQNNVSSAVFAAKSNGIVANSSRIERAIDWLIDEVLVALLFALACLFDGVVKGLLLIASSLADPLRRYTGSNHPNAEMLMLGCVICLLWWAGQQGLAQ